MVLVNKISDYCVYVQMKSFLSISLIILFLSANLDLKVASHYCGGSLAGTRVSFTGKMATCGMETDEENPPADQPTYNPHCCDNKVALLSVSDFYDISFNDLRFTGRDHTQLANADLCSLCINKYCKLSFYDIVKPPGSNLPERKTCPLLCTFRI